MTATDGLTYGFVVQAPAGAAVGESTHPLVAISPTARSQRGGQESALPRDMSWGGASSASGNTFQRTPGTDRGSTELGEMRPAFMDGSGTHRSM